MLRITMIFMNILTFLSAQFFSLGAFALTPTEVAAYNEFFTQTGVTKRDVPLKEMLEKFGQTMPAELRTQMENYLKENPNAVFPKIDAQKIGPEMQMTYAKGTDNLVVRTKSGAGSTWGSVVGTRNGVEVKEDISGFMFVDGAQYVQQQRAAEEMKKPKLLSAEDFQKLESAEKKQYLQKVRSLIESAETVQNGARTSKVAAKSESPAEPQPELQQGSCIIAGYVGNFSGTNKCKYPSDVKAKEGCQKGFSKCNPVLYGPDVCAEDKSIKTATAQCNKNAGDNLDKVIEHYSKNKGMSLQDKNSFDDLKKKLEADLKLQVQHCDSSKLIDDQKITCFELKKRITALNEYTCAAFEAKHVKTSSFKCQPQPVPAPVATTPAPAAVKPNEKPQAVTGSTLPQCPPTSATGADGGAPSGSAGGGNSATVGTGATTGASPQACIPATTTGQVGLPISGTASAGKTGDGADKTGEAGTPANGQRSDSAKATTAKQETGTGQPQPSTQTSTKTAEEKQKSDCELLNKYQGDLKCDGQVSKEVLTCQLTVDGKSVSRTLNYCECQNPKRKVVLSGFSSDKYATECAKSDPSRSSSSGSSSRKSDSSDFMKTAVKVLPFALGGLMLWAVHNAQKQQMQNYYDMYLKQMNSIQPPVPPPTTYTTPINLTPPAAGGTR